MIRNLIKSYSKVEPFIFDLIKAQFCVQLINSSFFILLNFYLINEDYKDYEIANFISWRYAAVALLGIPFGIFIKKRDLKKLMLVGAILFPIISLGIILAIPTKNVLLIKGLMAVYSVSFLLLHITPLPFIMKHCSAENRTSALALQFQVWGIAVMTVGIITFVLQRIDRQLFNDKNILLLFCMIGFIAVYYIQKIKVEKIHDEIVYTSHNFFKDYDWKLIWKATISVQLIAVGAGFTIPFISLFFQQVFDFNTEQFSILTSLSHFIVAFAMFITPWIKNRFGYKKGIIGVQSLAVVCLILFATTEWYKHLAIAPIIAMVMYVIRQPLMNSAGPLTSELSLEYVGAKNREMISSIDACIWNSGWLFSAIIFEYLRKKNMPYSNIFLITAALYSLGILANAWIISDLEKRKSNKSMS